MASEEAPALTRFPDGEPVLTASPDEAPSPTRAALRTLMIPENMRLYLTRDVILTPLPLRSPKGPAPPARAPKARPVPSTSPEGIGSTCVPLRKHVLQPGPLRENLCPLHLPRKYLLWPGFLRKHLGPPGPLGKQLCPSGPLKEHSDLPHHYGEYLRKGSAHGELELWTV
ncbi:hypothetical protein Q8A67_014627 [Cirrhinus molitorella]|nr:hypothetical protein Q8A67_014627 [Cirrhinus molitorella]